MRSLRSLKNQTLPFSAQVRSLVGALSSTNGSRTNQMAAYGAVSTLFAVVNRNSTATAMVDWRLYRKSASGDPEDRTPVADHLALRIWNNPNPFMPQQMFVESFEQHIELTGEGYWVIDRNPRLRSIPLGMWPVRPDRMEPIPDPKTFIDGWLYTAPDGTKIRLEVDEVIQLKMPNPLDIYRGMGPVQALMVTIDSSKYSAEWNRNFFRNSAQPGGILKVPDGLSDAEFDRTYQRWNSQHSGVSNAHRVALLEGNMEWVDRSFSQRDMQFTELLKLDRDIILEGFGFPKSELGITEDVNLANALAGSSTYARQLTVPRLERIKQALNGPFLKLFGETDQKLYEFDYCSPVPADRAADDNERTSKANAVSTYITAGFAPKDVLQTVGVPEMEYVGRTDATPAAVPAVPPPAEPAPPADA